LLRACPIQLSVRGSPLQCSFERSNYFAHHDTYPSFLCLCNWITDVKLKVKIASELRDSVEIFQSVEYARFLSILMPVFTDILMNGQPVFASNAPEQVRLLRVMHLHCVSAKKIHQSLISVL